LRPFFLPFLSGSCHLDRASNVEIGVELQIFVIIVFFDCVCVLQFGAHSRYYKGALTQKRPKQAFNTKFVILRPVEMA
jgi:hypothetical protein